MYSVAPAVFLHHTRWEASINGTRFVCLDMLGREPSKASGAWIDMEF